VRFFDLFGTYFPNASKTCLIVKPQHLWKARALFRGTGVIITDAGRCHLSSGLGTDDFVKGVFKTRCLCGWEMPFSVSFVHVVDFYHCHNKIRDLTASVLSEMHCNVGVEPALQPLDCEFLQQDGVHLDVVARDFWERNRQCAFLDARVFSPFARSYSLSRCMNRRKDEHMMKEFGRSAFPLWYLQSLEA